MIYDGSFWPLVPPNCGRHRNLGYRNGAGGVDWRRDTQDFLPDLHYHRYTYRYYRSLAGFALRASSRATGTAWVTSAVVGHPVAVSASDGSVGSS